MNSTRKKGLFSAYSASSKLIAGALAIVLTATLALSGWGMKAVMATVFDPLTVPVQIVAPIRRTAYVPANEAIRLEGASVELDLSVTVYLESGEIAAGFPFAFSIEPPDDHQEPFTISDDDLDGQIYVDGLEEGDYTVTMLAQEGVAEVAPLVIAVQPRVVYEVVDVSDKIVSSKDIDTSNDDKSYGGGNNTNGGNSQTLVDTVEYVESTKTVKQTPLLDASGNPVYRYKPLLSASGYLLYSSGAESDLIPILDSSGYITGAQRLAPESTPPAGGEEPIVVPPVEPPVEPQYVDATSEVLDASGKPLSSNGTYLFRFEQIQQFTGTETIVYTGWQTINGRTYYYNKAGNFVTGWQIIQGVKYFFSSDGVRDGSVGIDVSTWQENVNWAAVKAAGVNFVFIRVGFRGYSSGKLVMDDMYHSHMKGALAAGLKVGIYFFSQAINEAEAVEEASMCIQLVQGYNISYPIAIDVEDSGSSSGRADRLTTEQRTKVCIAFCETIRNSGYRPSVYANKYYFTSKLNAAQLENYVIWLAHYTDSTSYARRYDIWQYSSTGKVNGISGNVDMNISYI